MNNTELNHRAALPPIPARLDAAQCQTRAGWFVKYGGQQARPAPPPALVQHDERIAALQRQRQVVHRHQHGFACQGDGAQQENTSNCRRIQMVDGLIQQQDLRILRQHHGQIHALLFAAGQLAQLAGGRNRIGPQMQRLFYVLASSAPDVQSAARDAARRATSCITDMSGVSRSCGV